MQKGLPVTREEAYEGVTPLARRIVDNLGRVTRLSNKVLYKRRHPGYTPENSGNSPSIDVVSTEATIEFQGNRHEMMKALRRIQIGHSELGGPNQEGDLERWTIFEPACYDSGIHQTAVEITCEKFRF